MSLISVENLTFGYDFENIFENVSFCIDSDWKIGFVGRNGRGKTTFLQLLLGKLEYRGSISHSLKFDYFPFEVKDKTKLTIDVVFEIVPDFEQWVLQRELNLLCLDADCLYRPFSSLSNGEQSKVLLAALFLKDDNFLLIDEPTNHLDMEARRIVASYLNRKKSFVLVSHDKSFLDGCVDHILSINRSNIEVQSGNFSSYLVNKQRQDSFELLENEKLKGEIDKLKKAARQKADWSFSAEKAKLGDGHADRGYIGHKAAKVMKTATVLKNRQEQAMQEKVKLLKNIERAEDLNIMPQKHHCDLLVKAENLSVFFGDRAVFQNLSFVLNQGDRVALKGKNGSGKTTLLKLLQGEKLDFLGNLSLASNLKISYVSQETFFLQGNLKDFAQENCIDESLFKTILAKLDFSRLQFEKDMAEFSAGQKKKVLIAKSLCQRAHLYIWDEPLNYVDIISRMQIENLLQQCRPTMLFVEHDRSFSDKIATASLLLP